MRDLNMLLLLNSPRVTFKALERISDSGRDGSELKTNLEMRILKLQSQLRSISAGWLRSDPGSSRNAVLFLVRTRMQQVHPFRRSM